LDCSWCDVDVLVVGGFFVEIDSYAIATSNCVNRTSGNTMGLILDARGSNSLLKSIVYGKRRPLLRIWTQTLHLLSSEDTVHPWYAVSEALSKELDSSNSFDDDYQ